MKARSRALTAFLAGGAVLILAACGSGASAGSGSAAGSGSGSKSGAYVIGFEDALSGPFAAYGEWQLNYLKAAVAEANAAGGVHGHKIEIVTADIAAPGQDPASAARQLVESSNVIAVVGALAEATCSGIGAVTTPRDIPTVCYSVSYNQIYPPAKNIFSSSVYVARETAPAVQFAAQSLHLGAGTRWAALSTSNSGSVLMINATSQAANKRGWKLVDNEAVPAAAPNADSSIAKIVASKPDVVFTNPIYPWIAPLVKSLRAAGNNAPVLVYLNANYTGLTSLKDPNMYDVTLSDIITNVNTTAAGAAQLIAGMKTLGLTTLPQLNPLIGTQVYPADVALIQALKACGYPCSPQQLTGEMQQVSITLPGIVDGTYSWGSSHQPYHAIVINKWDVSQQQIVRVASLPLGEYTPSQ